VCTTPGYTCGGGSIRNVCGAARDSGVCTAITCETPSGRYCGRIGDGCGGILDCGLPCLGAETCGGGGTPNVCGVPPDGGCIPSSCRIAGTTYCGRIGDGCGADLDCTCPNGEACGAVGPNVCGRTCPECPVCDGAAATSVSGYAVTGAATSPDPVPGALVYVPRLAPGGTLPPLADGARCRKCTPVPGDSVIASAVTGVDGRFTLSNVPAGPAVPIVVQIGGWRRMTTIAVPACSHSELHAGAVRLPRNRSEGDIPLTAIVTGTHDPLECLLRKMGIADGEFTNPSDAGRIHLYRGTGAARDAATPDAKAFEEGPDGGNAWSRYTQVFLPCRGAEVVGGPSALANFTDYALSGGRLVLTHFSHTWLSSNGDWKGIGTWTPGAPAPADPVAVDVVTTMPTNADFLAWLANAGALSRTSPPQMSIRLAFGDLGALGPHATLRLSSFSPPTTQLATIGAPRTLAPDDACGRIAFADFHSATAVLPGTLFPAECSADLALSPQEKALEYMLFDLASCKGPTTTPPTPSPSPPRPAPPKAPPIPPPQPPIGP
jgi:hypothetical protein